MQAHSARYRMIRKLGCGGYASVYEALDTKTNLRVALKRQRASSHHDAESCCQQVAKIPPWSN
jgi:serine/threonine protein kinase